MDARAELEEDDEEEEEEGEGEEQNEEEEEEPMVGLDDEDSDDEVKAPPKTTLYTKIKSYITGTAVPPTTYGPPYLKGMPKIDLGLIEECDMPEPSVKDVHAILNEAVNPNCMDPASYNDTPLIKLARHCYTKESVKICEKLKEAGVLVNKCNILGITPLGRACMARPPLGPPTDQRIKFLMWLFDNGCDLSPIDKGGYTPMYHAVANGDIVVTKLLISRGALIRPNLTCKHPIDVAIKNNHSKLELILSKQLMKEEQEKRRVKLEHDKAQERAQEHRRKLAEKMAENRLKSNQLLGQGANYSLEKLSVEESKAMARLAYEKTASDALAASKRKDQERFKQIELLKTMESKHGIWKKVGKGAYRFVIQGNATDEETSRTLSLAENLYEEITFGPREKKLRLRWREKTGLQKRNALPPISKLDDDDDDRGVETLSLKKTSSLKSHNKKAASQSQNNKSIENSIHSERVEWLTFPGIKN